MPPEHQEDSDDYAIIMQMHKTKNSLIRTGHVKLDKRSVQFFLDVIRELKAEHKDVNQVEFADKYVAMINEFYANSNNK